MDFSKSDALYARACAAIPGGGQTMSKRPENYAPGAMPKMLVRGEGALVWDADGNQFIDYIGALGPVSLGYCYPEIDQAIAHQLENGIVFSFGHPLELEVAETMLQMLPGAEWVRFFKTGAESTSAAVRIARAVTGKEVVLSAGYHGWHDQWTAERSGKAARGVPAALSKLIVPFTLGATEGDRCLEALLDQYKGEVAAIVMEPVLYDRVDVGTALQQARSLADEHGAVLIFDEIVSGFRIARGGASEKYGVTPDLACWAKGIANGMPLAALTGKKQFHDLTATLVISTTYGGETLSLAAAKACLEIYASQDVIGHTTRLGERLLSGMQSAGRDADLKVHFGGHPMMGGYLFGYTEPDINRDLTTLFLQEMARRGVLFRRNGLLFISFSHTTEQIESTIKAAAEAMAIMANAIESENIRELLLNPDEPAVEFRVR